jgi:hypothetical protein
MSKGFTWLRHDSKLIECDHLFDGRNIEEIYLPEVEQLIQDMIGAKRVVAWNGVTRRKMPYHQDGK